MHMAGFLSALATGMALAWDDPAWNRASIKILDLILWQRYYLFFGGKLAGMTSFVERYRGGMVFWLMLCLSVGDYPYGAVVYVVGMLSLVRLNTAVPERVLGGSPGPVARALDWCGFGTHPGDRDKSYDGTLDTWVNGDKEKSAAKVE